MTGSVLRALTPSQNFDDNENTTKSGLQRITASAAPSTHPSHTDVDGNQGRKSALSVAADLRETQKREREKRQQLRDLYNLRNELKKREETNSGLKTSSNELETRIDLNNGSEEPFTQATRVRKINAGLHSSVRTLLGPTRNG
eukprot:GHVT01027231.1.p1 GENE.GHVT01027231.1~~GHVT01027231.1.p1  ORF type:complete len:143 (+),score=18.53 GHVT01027231.1:396-824(+)